MAKRQARERKAPTRDRHTTKRSTRAADVTFPELGDIKDRVLMRHAKTYADEMFQHEEALARANVGLQAIRTRMSSIEATHFVGHGYEFTRAPGEEKFSARKMKRGSKPAETVAPEEDVDMSHDELDDIEGGQ